MRNRVRLCTLCIALSFALTLELTPPRQLNAASSAFAETAGEAQSPEGGEEFAPAVDPAQEKGGAASEEALPPEPPVEDPAPLPEVESPDAPVEAAATPEPEADAAPAEAAATPEPEAEIAPEPAPEVAEVLPAPEEPEAEMEAEAPELFDFSAAEAEQPPAPQGFHLENGDLEIGLKESVSGALRPALPEGASGPVSYESSDSKIVTVDSKGKLKGVALGSATITASLRDGSKDSCEVTVLRAPVSVALSVGSTLLGVGETASFSVALNNGAGSYALSVASSKSGAVRVDAEKGEIVAVGRGTATITAKAFNGKKASVKITVKSAPTGLQFPSDEAPLGVGMKLPLAASYANKDAAGAISYSIAGDAGSSRVEGNVLTAGEEGEVTVRATAYNGASAEHTWRICAAPTELTLSGDRVTAGVGQTIAAPVSVAQDSEARPLYSYRTSDDRIVAVSGDGAITAKAPGSATITVTSYNGISANYDVDVHAAPAKIQIKANAAMGVDETAAPEVATPTAGAIVGAYTLTSSNSKIIEVLPGTQEIHAKAKGTATITAKSYNGKKASVKISVKAAPEGLQFTSSGKPLGVGMKLALCASCTNKGAAGAIRYEIASGGEFAALDGDVLSANGEGTVTVRAVAYNGASTEQALRIFPAPTALAISPERVEIGVKQTLAAPVEIEQDSPVRPIYSYRSSDDGIVSVNASGAITGKKTGSATITVTSYNDVSANYAVDVRNAPAKIQIKASTAMGVGETATPEVTTPTAGAIVGSYTLTSSNSRIIEVLPETREIRAKAKGTATITAKNYSGKKASVKISVKAAPEGLQFTSSGEPLAVGMTLALGASYTNSGAAGAIRYEITSGGEFAALDGNVLAANAPGEVAVTASSYCGEPAVQKLQICPAPTALAISPERVEIGVRQTLSAPVAVSQDGGASPRVSYSSSDLAVATVDGAGAITGKKTGSATITVTSYNGISANYAVDVRNAPAKIQIKSNAAMGVGETATPEVTTPTAGAIVGSYTLTSSNSKIIEVLPETLEIRAKAKGTATITAKSYNGKKASVKVSVKEEPLGLEFTGDTESLGVGMTLALGASYTNSGAAGAIRYEITSGGEFAALDGNVLTANAEGEVTVKASAYNGVFAQRTLQIAPAPESIEVAGELPLVAGVGERLRIEFAVSPPNAVAEYSFTSSNSAVASVDADGCISNLAPGSAVITITSHNGKSARLPVRVERYNSLYGTVAIGHRGASAYATDNSLESFEYAADLGAKWIETDVHLTKDGQLALYHNKWVTSGGKKRLSSSLTLSQLRKVNPKVITLDEGLDCVKRHNMSLLIEFKSVGETVERAVLEAVKRHGMEDSVYYDSFNWGCIKRLPQWDSGARSIQVVNTASELKKIIARPDEYSYLYGVSVRYTLLNANNVRELHLLGMHVSAWTPDSTSAIQKLCDMGVDGLTTNYPDRVVPYQK